jgi:GTP 3',8-cyclase
MTRDGLGRRIDCLRISVTESCNLRCRYCLPLRAPSAAATRDLLTPAELETVARAAVALDFHAFRLTGGEPTLRPDLLDIVARLAGISGVRDLAMTTNGLRLRTLAVPLARAGLRRVNIHVDTFDPGRLPALMRFADPAAIEAAIDAAREAGLRPVKVNCVVVRGGNEEDVVALARRAHDRGWHVRFIELMALGTGEPAAFARERFVASWETRARVEAALGPLVPRPAVGSGPAATFGFKGRSEGTVGFISATGHAQCATCNRMRLTADGRFRPCLLRDDELDVRAVLRAGGGAAAVAAVLAQAVARKPPGHHRQRGVPSAGRLMGAIGG